MVIRGSTFVLQAERWYIRVVMSPPKCRTYQTKLNRRRIITVIAGFIALPRMAHAVPAPPPARRRLRLINLHTGEKFDGSYRDDSGPLADAMADLSVLLRDFHSAATIEIDVAVIDFLAAVMDAVDAESASILSAYRTPETNAMLARTTFGVAENSQHLYGRALDVHFGTRLTAAMRAARAMQRGGVGWYPWSGFLHIDTGPVRNWNLDERGLGSLLLKGRHLRRDDDTVDSHRYTAELQRSGLLQPGMENSGHVRPEMQRSSRLLPEMAGGRRLR
jgi:uncharacterized protein YcbK (DUF882 family)